MKLAVSFFTGVLAIFAEALHTLSDIFVSGFLLVALIWSRNEADDVHKFGYGRAQNVAALVAAKLFISVTNGHTGTAMPTFADLSESQRWDVIASHCSGSFFSTS